MKFMKQLHPFGDFLLYFIGEQSKQFRSRSNWINVRLTLNWFHSAKVFYILYLVIGICGIHVNVNENVFIHGKPLEG